MVSIGLICATCPTDYHLDVPECQHFTGEMSDNRHILTVSFLIQRKKSSQSYPVTPRSAFQVIRTENHIQAISVYPADCFIVTDGAHQGDAISYLEDLVPDDIYGLATGAERRRLALQTLGDGACLVARDSEVGRPGAALHLDCAIKLMSPDGQTTDALILVEVDGDQAIAGIYMLPLAPLQPKVDYTLVGMERDSARRKFAQVACVSFTRGTHITMSNGAQVPIEDLKVGDRVLTRDDGARAIRWIGQSTTRAVGDFAPIVIRAGTLNNEGDLIVSPDHRLFIYQRSDELGAGRSELLLVTGSNGKLHRASHSASPKHSVQLTSWASFIGTSNPKM